jgi:hypothetical protein
MPVIFNELLVRVEASELMIDSELLPMTALNAFGIRSHQIVRSLDVRHESVRRHLS